MKEGEIITKYYVNEEKQIKLRLTGPYALCRFTVVRLQSEHYVPLMQVYSQAGLVPSVHFRMRVLGVKKGYLAVNRF